jgi:hypothetical protein
MGCSPFYLAQEAKIMEMPIPDDWDGVKTCRWAICWPDSSRWQAILSGLIETPMQGRFWDFETGNFLDLRDAFKPSYDYNFDLKGVIVACNDTGLSDIASAINNLATATAHASAVATATGDCGCQGSDGAGQFPQPENETEAGDPASDPPPAGYDSWEQFFTQKCGMIFDFLSRLQDTLANIATVSVGSIALADLVAVIIVLTTLTISSAGIVAIAGIILAIGSVVVATTMIDLISANIDDLVCALFDGTSADGSRAAFLSKWNEIVEAASVDPIETFVMEQLMVYLTSPDEINRLYDVDHTRGWEGLGDCSGCNCSPVAVLSDGVTGVEGNSVDLTDDVLTMTLGFEDANNQYRCDAWLKDAVDEEQFCEKWLQWESADGVTAGVPPVYVIYGAGNTVERYASYDAPTVRILGDAISVRSATDGVVVFTVHETEED